MSANKIEIRLCQPLKPGELYSFYKRNNICEEGYGEELAESVLKHEGIWAAAYDDGKLVAFARALYDGLHGQIMEINLDLQYQTENKYANGCFIESDPEGIAKAVALAMLKELRRRGCYFFSAVLYEHALEKEFYKGLGFNDNTDHKNYILNARPYDQGGTERGDDLDREEI